MNQEQPESNCVTENCCGHHIKPPLGPPLYEYHNKIADVLRFLGSDVDSADSEMYTTPIRFFKYLQEFYQEADLEAILKEGFENASADGGMVIQARIPFRGCCAHHLLPFFGTASIGYVPRKRMVGLSKLARLVDAAGTRAPSTQEEITNVVADTLHKGMESLGVVVVTRAVHTCMSVRGVNAPNVETSVSAIRGIFMTNPAAKSEFLSIVGLQ